MAPNKRKKPPKQLKLREPVEPNQPPPNWRPGWFGSTADETAESSEQREAKRQKRDDSPFVGPRTDGGMPSPVGDKAWEVEEEEAEEEEDTAMRRAYQGASVYMQQFIDQKTTIMDYMLMHESTPALETPCECGQGMVSCFCNDCQHYTPSCVDCFIDFHRRNPWHWAQHWEDGTIVQRDITDLAALYIVTIGHATRSPVVCEEALNRLAPEAASSLTLVHTNGIHTTKVVYCDCHRNDGLSHFEKLLQSRIFPASVTRPRIGFTFEVLHDYHVLTLASKKSGYDFVAALQRKSTCFLPSEVHDIYRQFMRVYRVWSTAVAEKRAGLPYAMDKKFPNRRPQSMVVPCFTCPERGFNIDHETMESTPDRYIHLVQLSLSADGHFGLQRFKKVDDPDDLSMWTGRGFFPHAHEYNPYVVRVVKTSVEKSTCSDFKAIDLQNRLKFKGCDVTGVVGVECGRHSVFLAMVDLHKGERFTNVDFALARALRQYVSDLVPMQSLQAAKFFRRILMTYDVACVFYVHLRERFDENFADLAAIIDAMYLLVPKMHLYGHKEECRFKFALNFLAYAGRIHGEGIEPSWGETKQSGGSTRQMNPGHRHDRLNEYHNYWNWKKMEGTIKLLAKQLLLAIKRVDEKVSYFVNMSRVIGKTRVEKWAAQDDRAWVELSVAERKNWKSPYQLDTKKLISRDQVLRSLEDKELETLKKNDLSTGMSPTAKWINMGITTQVKQTKLRTLSKSKSTASEQDTEALRDELVKDLQEFRTYQLRDVPALEGLLAAVDRLDLSPENKILLLPSDILHNNVIKKLDINIQPKVDDPFSAAIRLGECGSIELQLRKGQANDAIENLCEVLIHGMLLTNTKNRHAQGVNQTTRAMKYIQRAMSKKGLWSGTYSHARRCILRLEGRTENADFPELRPRDMYTKNAVQSIGLGDGSITDSWIWTYGSLRDMDATQKQAFLDEVQRVRWFRARADMRRWIEEKEVLEEEFRRYIMACNRMADIWKEVSQVTPTDGSLKQALRGGSKSGYVVYALQKSRMFRRYAQEATNRFTKKDLDGGWPASGQTMWDYLDQRRPNVEIPWDEQREGDAEELEKMRLDIIRLFEKPDDEEVEAL
ncbi:hypothetical protein PQX77_022217 [Marasmius sp. AFHP31]|nr:hypothetical protein PQX77_022217 [Marasmius sp. AFHP31]